MSGAAMSGAVAAVALDVAEPVAATVAITLAACWAGFALWYRGQGRAARAPLWLALWACFGLAALAAVWLSSTTAGVLIFGAGFAGIVVWWRRLAATNEGDWADEVAEISHGTVDDAQVTLHNVRNFDWRTVRDYTARWETRHYDLSCLRSVDMIMSYWRGPAIAHMLISFGFDPQAEMGPDTQAQIAFSVEIRRRENQAFSEIGGFFKEFELSIIACDERDAVRLRSNVRGEDLFLYRLQLPASAMRSLFLSYLDEANGLLAVPRFYNTIAVNCTTLVYQMMNRIVGHLPLDYRLLFSGYLPEYVYRVGGLDRRFPFAELRARGRLTERARAADRSPNFSRDIRRGIPGID